MKLADAEHSLCNVGAGWGEFYEAELAQFYRETFGVAVRVVPDGLPRA